jgi:hypothetical protein
MLEFWFFVLWPLGTDIVDFRPLPRQRPVELGQARSATAGRAGPQDALLCWRRQLSKTSSWASAGAFPRPPSGAALGREAARNLPSPVLPHPGDPNNMFDCTGGTVRPTTQCFHRVFGTAPYQGILLCWRRHLSMVISRDVSIVSRVMSIVIPVISRYKLGRFATRLTILITRLTMLISRLIAMLSRRREQGGVGAIPNTL